MKSGSAALSLNCREAARAQSEMLEHPLPRPVRAGLWVHLRLCKWCRRYGEQIRFLRHAAQAHQEQLTVAAPQQLSAGARERIKQQLRGEN